MMLVGSKLFPPKPPRSGIAAGRHFNAARSMVPFILPAVTNTSRPVRCGRGMLVPVTGAKNTSIPVTHNLGRFVQYMWPLLNNAGQTFTPKLMFGTETPTQQVQNIIADEDLVDCLILFF